MIARFAEEKLRGAGRRASPGRVSVPSLWPVRSRRAVRRGVFGATSWRRGDARGFRAATGRGIQFCSFDVEYSGL